ncbi:YiiX family permuted papain-like enzyme [Bernardetia sp. OM2101]|uniref:YiiX family permuted papain-like enzyme n=1 Tax=Bernardetia sp. OM2101 TaxID=3344876 RepID=UPI0035CF61BE
MILSKNLYLCSLFLLFLSCHSEKTETKTEIQKEIVVNKLEEKTETQKQNVENSSSTKVLKEGDIIFQTSTSSQSKAIQLATKSKYSHVGIIFKVKKNGSKSDNFVVLEAVEPVKFTPLKEWVKRGKNAHFVVKRLKNADEILTDEAIQKMRGVGENLVGKNYDLYFEWSDERIYCSELVWKIYKEALDIEVGKLEKLASFDLNSKTVKDKMKERYGNKISPAQLNERVISPAAVFESDELIFVK